MKGRDYLVDLGVWMNSIRIDLREIGWEDADWIQLVRDRDQWRAVVDDFRIKKKGG